MASPTSCVPRLLVNSIEEPRRNEQSPRPSRVLLFGARIPRDAHLNPTQHQVVIGMDGKRSEENGIVVMFSRISRPMRAPEIFAVGGVVNDSRRAPANDGV